MRHDLPDLGPPELNAELAADAAQAADVARAELEGDERLEDVLEGEHGGAGGAGRSAAVAPLVRNLPGELTSSANISDPP